jgi:hypothetical protein
MGGVFTLIEVLMDQGHRVNPLRHGLDHRPRFIFLKRARLHLQQALNYLEIVFDMMLDVPQKVLLLMLRGLRPNSPLVGCAMDYSMSPCGSTRYFIFRIRNLCLARAAVVMQYLPDLLCFYWILFGQ